MIVRTAFLAVSFVAIGFCVCATSAADREKTPPSAKQRRDEIRKLIEQLNAEAFKDREAAMRRLMERDDALAALKEAAKSDNAEVRRRAEKAIEAINKRLGKRKAGVRKGDCIEAVEGVKVASVEEFRRLLRRRMQASNVIRLDVRREEQLVHLVVRVPGDAP
jgi:predicted metalloprotease with PDZ domain